MGSGGHTETAAAQWVLLSPKTLRKALKAHQYTSTVGYKQCLEQLEVIIRVASLEVEKNMFYSKLVFFYRSKINHIRPFKKKNHLLFLLCTNLIAFIKEITLEA